MARIRKGIDTLLIIWNRNKLVFAASWEWKNEKSAFVLRSKNSGFFTKKLQYTQKLKLKLWQKKKPNENLYYTPLWSERSQIGWKRLV